MEKAMAMNPEVKARWVAALRSGKYEQGRDHLRIGAKFCCLGVLCDVIDPTGWNPADEHDRMNGLPSERIAYAAGFEKGKYGPRTPKVSIDGLTTQLDSHNDNGKTFAQIADAIEAQL